MNRPAAALVRGGLVAMLAAGLASCSHGSGVSNGGPVSAGAANSAGQRLGVGEQYSFGNVVLTNRSKTPAQLETIRVVGLTPGFEVLGVRAVRTPVTPNELYSYVGDFGFPPAKYPSTSLTEEHTVPVATTFKNGEPYEGLELVIGAKATRPGVVRARGVEFTYRIGSHRYKQTFDGAMYLCAPKEQFQGDACPGDARNRFGDLSAEFPVAR